MAANACRVTVLRMANVNGKAQETAEISLVGVFPDRRAGHSI
jgi:hypothetical protein